MLIFLAGVYVSRLESNSYPQELYKVENQSEDLPARLQPMDSTLKKSDWKGDWERDDTIIRENIVTTFSES